MHWQLSAGLVAAVAWSACGGGVAPPPATATPSGAGDPSSTSVAGSPAAAGGRCSVAVQGDTPDALTGPALRATLEPLLDRCRSGAGGTTAQLTAQFAIGATGCVEQVGLRPEPEQQELSACLRSSFEALRFPPPGQGGVVLVRYPLLLASRRSP